MRNVAAFLGQQRFSTKREARGALGLKTNRTGQTGQRFETVFYVLFVPKVLAGSSQFFRKIARLLAPACKQE